MQSLNNPTLAPPPSAKDSKDKPEESASQKKKRKKAEGDSLPLNVRAAAPPYIKREPTQKQREWRTDDDEVKLGSSGSGASRTEPASKKPKLEQGVFARPAGMEGALKGKGAKGKGKKVEEKEPVWGKRGDAREWDEGKGGSDSESDSEDGHHGVFDVVDDEELESQSDSDDDDEDVEEMLGRGKGQAAVGKKAEKAAFEREVEEMFRREEEGGSSKQKGAGSGKGKKMGGKTR